jgi:hypothetical protein
LNPAFKLPSITAIRTTHLDKAYGKARDPVEQLMKIRHTLVSAAMVQQMVRIMVLLTFVMFIQTMVHMCYQRERLKALMKLQSQVLLQ